MATIGRKAAIAELGPLKLWGMPAWWGCGARSTSRSWSAPRNRFAVMFDWAWAIYLPAQHPADYRRRG